jgi:hypothetical protein
VPFWRISIGLAALKVPTLSRNRRVVGSSAGSSYSTTWLPLTVSPGSRDVPPLLKARSSAGLLA